MQNTNRWDTRQLVTMALMAALAALLSFVEIAIFPPAPFLKYDPSLVPSMVTGFAFGAGPGVLVGIVAALIHALITSNWIGAAINILVTFFFVAPAALIYKRNHTLVGGIIGLIVGVILAMTAAILGNATIALPFYYGGDINQLVPIIIPILVPFNLLKGGINSILTIIIYKTVSNLITPVKDQVKGK